jgi:hypothetical protein
MGTYVEVPADTIRAKLTAAGFKLTDGRFGHEEVFDRIHDKDRRYIVRVFTSITHGGTEARAKGTDAIRVYALFFRDAYVNPGNYRGQAACIYNGKRVHRSGSVEAVLERMMERARDAYAFCNCRIQENKSGKDKDQAR